MPTNPYSVPSPESQPPRQFSSQQYPQSPYPQQPFGAPPPPSRVGARVISGVLGFVLAPLGLWLISYGGERQRIRFAGFLSGSDALGVTMTVLGALVLFGVATLGALSSTGPIVGGVFWGVVPGIAMMVDPVGSYRTFADALGTSAQMRSVLDWMSLGVFLAVGMVLAGAGLAAAITRRRASRRLQSSVSSPSGMPST